MKHLFSLTILLLAAFQLTATATYSIELTNNSLINAKQVSGNTDNFSIILSDGQKLQLPAVLIKSVITNSGMTAAQKGKIRNNFRIACGGGFNHGNSSIYDVTFGLYWDRNRQWIDQWTTSLQGNLLKESGDITAQYLSGSIRYGLSLTKQLYTYIFTSAVHDYPAGVDWRWMSFAGAGYWFSDNKSFRLMLEIGAGYRLEQPSDLERTGTVTAQFRVYSGIQLYKNLSAAVESSFYPAVETVGSYRWENSINLKWELNRPFAWKVSYRFYYETDPVPEASTTDGRMDLMLLINY